MKLIGSLTSPFVRKTRIVMIEKKLDYEFVLEDVWSSVTTITESNPLGKVPCLIMEGGEAVFDSRVIVEYLDTLSPVGKLIPQPGRERAAVKTWEALADGVADAMVAIHLEKNWSGRTSQERSTAWITRQEDKVRAGLEAMENGLDDGPYCIGNHLCLADIAVGCALDYLDLRFATLNWQANYPKLRAMQARLAQRPSFTETRPPR